MVRDVLTIGPDNSVAGAAKLIALSARTRAGPAE